MPSAWRERTTWTRSCCTWRSRAARRICWKRLGTWVGRRLLRSACALTPPPLPAPVTLRRLRPCVHHLHARRRPCCCYLHLLGSHFEEKGSYDKAVQLYQKGGNVTRALDLCFKGQLFDVLRSICACAGKSEVGVGGCRCPDGFPAADALTETASPETLVKCAEFFMEHGQAEKAVHLYINAREFDKVGGGRRAIANPRDRTRPPHPTPPHPTPPHPTYPTPTPPPCPGP